MYSKNSISVPSLGETQCSSNDPFKHKLNTRPVVLLLISLSYIFTSLYLSILPLVIPLHPLSQRNMARSFDSRGNSHGSERPLDEDSELLPNSNKNKATPLPSLQLLILAAVRLAEPICYTQVSVSFGVLLSKGKLDVILLVDISLC